MVTNAASVKLSTIFGKGDHALYYLTEKPMQNINHVLLVQVIYYDLNSPCRCGEW